MNAKFTPTPEMTAAAEALFMAKAYVQTIKPIVEEYQKRIIAEINPKVADRFSWIGFTTITEAKDSYLMNEADFNIYLQRCHDEAIKAGFQVPEFGYCPLLIAEDLERQAEHALVNAMFEISHLSVNDILCSGLEKYHKFIDLSLRLLAPFVKNNIGVC